MPWLNRKKLSRAKPIRRPMRLGSSFIALEDRLAPAVDLVASTFSAPLVVAAGSPASVKFSVTNIGSTAATASFSDRIVLSDDAIVGNDQVLQTIGHTGPVNSGQNFAVNTTVNIPAGSTGLKSLILISDVVNQSGDVNSANNIRVIPLAVLAPAAAGPAADLIVKVQGLIAGKLAPTGVNAAGTSVTFDVATGQTYQLGGFRLTDVHTTVTVGPNGVSANGSGNLHVPLSGANEVVIPVTFAATPTNITVDGAATLPSFRYGNEPALITAQNVGLVVHLAANLSTGAVTGGVTFNAATARVLATNVVGQVPAGPVTLTNVAGSLSPTGQLQARAAGIAVAFRDFVRISGANAVVVANVNQTNGAVVTVASARVTSPKFPGAVGQLGAITINANGFSVGAINLAAPTINLPNNSQISNFAMSVTGLAFSRQNGFSVASMTASASQLRLFGGRAIVNQINFAFNGQTGVATGSAANTTGAIGPVSFSGGPATLQYEVGAQLPAVRLNTATVTVPVGSGTATLTATGFRFTADGQFRFDALAGLTLPQLNGQGITVTGSFSGDVHVSGTTIIVHLQGQANAFGVPVRLVGDFTATSSGLFGVFDVQGVTGGAMPVLGIAGGLSGEAHIAVNATNAARSMTNDGQTRVVAANSSWVLASGDLSVGAFTLNGRLDLFKEGDHWRANPTATADLRGFGSFTVGGSFKVLANGGVVGSMSLTRATGAVAVIEILGTYRLDVNTTPAAQDGIPPGVRLVVTSATIQLAPGLRAQGTFTIGFANGDYFASVTTATVSLWNGVATATVSGTVRSNGVFDVAGTTRLVLTVPGIGIGLNTSLVVTISRSTPGGPVAFNATGSGGITLNGVELVGATVSVDQAGHVTVTGNLAGLPVSLTFDL
jgi:hypothetical protein